MTGSRRIAAVPPLCTKYKTLSKMLADRRRKVIGQAKQIHQPCWLPGRSVMNNLSRMMDVWDVLFPGIIGVTDACHDAEVAEGHCWALSDEQERFSAAQCSHSVRYMPTSSFRVLNTLC